MQDKWKCKECYQIWETSQLLEAKNPFDQAQIVIGCPTCRSVNTMERLCEHDGCIDFGTIGTPTTDGYVWHCHKHPPPNAKTA